MASEARQPSTFATALTPSEALWATFQASGLSLTQLAKAIGVDPQALRYLAAGRISLATADKLFVYFGLAIESYPGEFSEALRAAIKASGKGVPLLSKGSGVGEEAIYRLLRGDPGTRLATADKLFVLLGLRLFSADTTINRSNRTGRPTLSQIQAAYQASGLGPTELSRKSGVSTCTIGLIKSGSPRLNLKDVTIAKLSRALGIEWEPAYPFPLSIKAPAPIPRSESSPASMVSDSQLLAFNPDYSPQLISNAHNTSIATSERPGDAVQPIRDPILAEIEKQSLDATELARITGMRRDKLTRLLDRTRDVRLDVVDRVCEAIGLGFIWKTGEAPAVPSVAIRAGIDASGFSFRKLSQLSGVSHHSISGFKSGALFIELTSAHKLADVLGLVAVCVRIAGRRCPVELRGEGQPIILDSITMLPDMNGESYNMLKRLVDDFKLGVKTPLSDLAALSHTKRIRPLKDALDRYGFEPLKRRIRETKEGRIKFFEIVSLPD